MRSRTALVLLFLLLTLPAAASAQSSTGLPAGCHLATEADKAAGGSDIVVGVTSICPSDVKAGISADVGAAKDYLYSNAKNLRNSCAPVSDRRNIDRLNNGFAVCAAAFLKAYQARYGTATVVSAFRDGAPGTAIDGSGRSANQCAGGAPNSNHTRGLAVDINPTGGGASYATLWKFASDNPQFGVCFPYQDGSGSGYRDPPHMALAGIGGREGYLCDKQGVTKACTAGASFTPTTPTTSTPSPSVPLPPRRDIGSGAQICDTGYVLFDGQCYPMPDEVILPDTAGTCPARYVRTTIPDYENSTSYETCLPPTPQTTPTSIVPQSYCQVGYLSVGGQCLPTRCDGFSPYAVISNNPIRTIQCSQQATQCPQGYVSVGYQCVPNPQNQNGAGSSLPGASNVPSSGTQGGNTTPGAATQCAVQYFCQDSIMYYQTSACTLQIYQTCAYGCAGSMCATSTTTNTTTVAAATSSGLENILNRIDQLFYPATPSQTTTNTVVDILMNTLSGNTPTTNQTQTVLPILGGSEASLIQTGPQNFTEDFFRTNYFAPTQTFSSNMGNGSRISGYAYSPESRLSLFQQAFLNMRLAFLGILSYWNLLNPTNQSTGL